MTSESPCFFQVDSLLEKSPIRHRPPGCNMQYLLYLQMSPTRIYLRKKYTCTVYINTNMEVNSLFISHSGRKKPVSPVAARPSNRESQSTTYVEYRAVSGVFQYILTPHPLYTQRVCPPPHQRGGGGGTHSLGGEGVEVNILEDARHSTGLLQYNPSTPRMIFFHSHICFRKPFRPD
jgi:hypothetical protein